MSIFFFTTFICLMLAIVVFFYVQYQIQLRKAQGKQPSAGVSLSPRPAPVTAASTDTRWKAVKVKVDLMCCKPAERISEQVFLVAEAPQFPLKNCDSTDCQCRYVHLTDRRDGGDRRESTLFLKDHYLQNEKDRRKLKDRRRGK